MGRLGRFANLQCRENPGLFLTDGREPGHGLGLVNDDAVVLNAIEQGKRSRGRAEAATSARVWRPLRQSSRLCKTTVLNSTVGIATERERAIVKVLRPLGIGPLSLQQAKKAGELLGIHWSTVYRFRRRFLEDPVASALIPHDRGPKVGSSRLAETVEEIVSEVLTDWLPRQRHLAYPLLELCVEIRKRCAGASVNPPSRPTISRRWAARRKAGAQGGARVRVRRRVTESKAGGIDHGLADPCVGAV
ncbi:hypothetical protein D9M68_239180 [compost metagenome]